MVTRSAGRAAQDEIIELLELAVGCKLITAEQEREILPKVMKQPPKAPEETVARYLYQSKILDKDQIEFLYAVRKHLDLLMLDKKFGKLGIANEFVTSENIQKALDIQVEIFKKRRKSVKIGDILVSNNEITEANKTAILLTQDRIRDDYLVEALNAIATSELENNAINKRFGAIAVKKELISTDQLNQALKFQKKEAGEIGKKRYLGEILQEMFALSKQDILAILKTQKKLETKRLNLQEKLLNFNAEKESIRALDHFLELKVADDKLNARVRVKNIQTPKITAGDAINWLNSRGIKYGLICEKMIEDFFGHPEPGAVLNVAKGVLPVKAKPEKISYLFDIAAGLDTDHPKSVKQVKKDDVLATVIPFEEGAPGKDVFGHPVIIEVDPEPGLNSGEGVARRENDFVALIDGIPRLYKNRTLFVMPVDDAQNEIKEIDGDITAEKADAYSGYNLHISGNVAQGVTLECNAVTIQGNVFGNIKALGDVQVEGMIGEKSQDEDIEPVIQVISGGVLNVSGKHICAKIVADKGLNAPKSRLVNSRVFSSGDVRVGSIKSSQKVPTVVRVAVKNALEIQKLSQAITRKKKTLDEMTHQEEIQTLSRDLMEQVQVQNGYLEKQNVLSYLVHLMRNDAYCDLEKLKEKIDSDEADKGPEEERRETIPKNTKAWVFLQKILEKLSAVDPDVRRQYVTELYDSICGIYTAAVKKTDRINKQYEARTQQIEADTKKDKELILKQKEALRKLESKRDYLLVESQKTATVAQLRIKVKNEISKFTVLKGKEAQIEVKEPIYNVFVRERSAAKNSPAQMIVEGFFG